MKKWLIWAVIVIALGTWIVRTFDVPYTKYMTDTLQGVQIQLGATDNGSKPVTVQIDGTLHRSIRGKLTYKGTIRIVGEGLSNNDHGLRIPFTKYGKTIYSPWIMYNPFEFKEEGFSEVAIFNDPNYQGIFTDEDMSHLVIPVNQEDKGWNSLDGSLIVAPAANRAEAMALAKPMTHGYAEQMFGAQADTWLK